jgi:4-diphosphocytidyl-2-C-methyl-D-erythritol kinase
VSTQAQLTVFSPAKINVYLRILGKRPDEYHDLETVMLPLDFGDELTLEACPSGIHLACDHPSLPVDDTNLVVRAAKRFAEATGVKAGVQMALRKRTPLAAGLGGGSSNAALVLDGLNRLWKANASPATLHELAAGMGSDINFFLQGGAAMCRGRGERVEPVPCRLSAAILLINPGFGISTKWAYESWAKAAAGLTVSAPDASVLLRALAEDDVAGVSHALFNSLEAASVRKFPVLELLKKTMRTHGAAGALMSGSGATVFGLFEDSKQAEQAAQQIRAEFGPSMWTCVTKLAATPR